MDHYQDIIIFCEPEFPMPVLMNALYSQFHKALCDLHSTSIGVSFPKYDKTLGNILRLHGNQIALQGLQNLNWIGGMKGYCVENPILSVPVCTKFRTVYRKQPTKSQSKLRRLIERRSLTEAQIDQYEASRIANFLDSAYFQLVSGSNGKKHRRYIVLGKILDQPVPGEFDRFGLSKTATIPWFSEDLP
ncbi:type I-F CRISPR-associated endoribonuclease Cas6/Csy4 [Legionella taurinensis]|uniref:Type I-F CRISPR-associated endoribonuclease Cas6/Csy4 n=1 Tax=Legionella taurinensis TaxID=70611 RepID=A0A3A5LG36_9GAMM|nr:type I-F CRISPR-associated endoribonuclease Cas6/Csy4 [Legionella taurinensis]RJT47787.1 type I-F CRISPR-associated endoribonuclease Cas6/Csy4 [Legionella taurinensis]RJT67806.1 type I-F CRISPR-associated endoribonuclease Cas6/Csy4 [Legionella taurinensis]STY25782.1 CRISPR-associated protein Cas6/Csy4, subtype I-F/YPEST [Legionella taurinensis]